MPANDKRDNRTHTFGRGLVSDITGPHTKRATGEVPAYKYFKVRSSVYDRDGKEIKESIQKFEVKTNVSSEALEKGFATATTWADTSF